MARPELPLPSARRRRSEGSVLVDAAALQSPMSRGRGIAAYAAEWIVALEAHRPDLVACYLLEPSLPPPAVNEALVATGKLAYRDEALAAYPNARIFHSLSVLDPEVPLEATWPTAAHRRGLLRSATVYDLIPALDPETYLADPLARRRYRSRLELVRSADGLHVLSAAVARDLGEVLSVPSERVVIAGASPGARYSPAASPDELEPAGRLLGGLEVPFVLAPGGSHPRKNNELLVEAWALLPTELKRRFRLVITGEVAESTANHYRHLAAAGGFADHLVVAGHVSDAELLALFRSAHLVCFPSLAEGYGLPVAQAIACGTPVIASDQAPIDELLEAPARFDPSRPLTIAEALAEALASAPALDAIRAAGRPPLTSAAVAERTAAGFERLLHHGRRQPPLRPGSRSLAGSAGQQRRGAPRLPRVAFVSPFPPAPTGVAAYSYRLVEELLASGEIDLDVYFDGPTRNQQAPGGVPARSVQVLAAAERLLGPYDAVCYSLGNSHHHVGALAALRERRGAVLAHDVRLTNCYRHERGNPLLPPGQFQQVLHAMYPERGLPADLGENGELSAEDIARYGILMAREAIERSTAYFVSSTAAVALARLDARPDDAGKVDVLPFAIEAPDPERSRFAAEGTRPWAPELEGDGPLVAHFGIVDPVKLPATLLEAVAIARVAQPQLRVAFVGPIAESLATSLRRRAAELAIAEALVITGPLGATAYRDALRRTTVAVQLRSDFNGEASAAVGQCLASAVPTVVSNLGWARDLDSAAVVALDPPIGASALAQAIEELLDDEGRRAALAAAGREEARRRTFALTARALLDELVDAASQAGSAA